MQHADHMRRQTGIARKSFVTTMSTQLALVRLKSDGGASKQPYPKVALLWQNWVPLGQHGALAGTTAMCSPLSGQHTKHMFAVYPGNEE